MLDGSSFPDDIGAGPETTDAKVPEWPPLARESLVSSSSKRVMPSSLRLRVKLLHERIE
ncbi:hypothetical protein AKJ09_00393 [Labilithrix luteola]|uniref:Uncharacterized protein n=1 Tax=Labilithrix luteola TaxID=1391654 RepID=A0A0K1PKV8_9BACT|nr:hypothetical protein AKJ09_00393 [Labilithrix luteola]